MKRSALTVLVVEDHTSLRVAWTRMISTLARVESAATVSEALALIDKADVLVLDWKLGNEMADAVLDRWVDKNGGPVCVVTGVLDQDAMYDLYARGAYHVFAKPIPPAPLLSSLRRCIEYVEQKHTIRTLGVEVVRLRRAVIVLAFVAAAGAMSNAPDIIPIVLSFI